MKESIRLKGKRGSGLGGKCITRKKKIFQNGSTIGEKTVTP